MNEQADNTPLERVTGVQLMQGIGHKEAKGFWAEAWAYVLRRPAAILSLIWLGIVAFFAVFSPVIASGHPVVYRTFGTDEAGDRVVTSVSSPMWDYMSSVDILLLLGTVLGGVFLAMPRMIVPMKRSKRLATVLSHWMQGGFVFVLSLVVIGFVERSTLEAGWFFFVFLGVALVASIPWAIGAAEDIKERLNPARLIAVLIVAVVCSYFIHDRAVSPLVSFQYRQLEKMGEAEAVFTIVPFSPNQGTTSGDLKEPLTTLGEAVGEIDAQTLSQTDDVYYMGTNSKGEDVLSQMLHACRLSISIGLVSTGIAVFIGITIGALMGYFGGWVDMVLMRVVEIFMAIPVLFLLIVAAAVLPRNIYVMMAIIGLVTWTGAARFTRAEFMKLRNQDFVQSAQAVGLPLRSLLFKHMLPNGVTPVLVDSSFAIAAAINIEVVLSFLGLGPAEQPSWGRLLSDARNDVGQFIWWLAIFPGMAIFLTILAYNLIGEALRDAIDPKLKKARV